VQDYTRLVVWQRARSLSVAANEISQSFKPTLAPGLRSQLMRAVMSISTNVAEGAGRDSRIDFARFITIAIASANEVEHHLIVALDLSLVDQTIGRRIIGRCVEVRRMLFGLRRALLRAAAERGALTRPTDGESHEAEPPTPDRLRGPESV
jgi:four helix bundle protein